MTAIIGLLDTCNDSKGTFSNDYGAHRTDIVVSRQGAASRLSSAVTADVVPRASLTAADRSGGWGAPETLSLEQGEFFGVPTVELEHNSWPPTDYD